MFESAQTSRRVVLACNAVLLPISQSSPGSVAALSIFTHPQDLLCLLREITLHGWQPEASSWTHPCRTGRGREGECRVTGVVIPSFSFSVALCGLAASLNQKSWIWQPPPHGLWLQVLVTTPFLFRPRAGARPGVTSLK